MAAHGRANISRYLRLPPGALLSAVVVLLLWSASTFSTPSPLPSDDGTLDHFFNHNIHHTPSLMQSNSKKGSQRSSSHRCFALPDYSEFCVYHNVCLGGHQLSFSPGSLPDPSLRPRAGTEPSNADDYQNLPTLGTGTSQDLQTRVLPWRSFLALDVTDKESIFDNSPHPVVELGFLSGFDSDGGNLFHFAESVLLFHAIQQQQWNGTVLDLPPLSMALLDRPRPPAGSWISDFASMLFATDRILWSDQLRAYTADAPLCFQNLVVGGTIIHLLQGPRDAEQLKAKAYAALGLSHCPRPSSLPRRVLVEVRGHRSWTNHAEIEEVLRRVGVPYVLVSFANMTFAEQVSVMAGAGVFCSAHGAGMTNLMWMPTGAAVVEVFPSESWEYNLYAEVARNAGLFHVAAHGGSLTDSWRQEVQRTARDCLNDYACNVGSKTDFYLEPSRFEQALRRALSLAGVSTGGS